MSDWTDERIGRLKALWADGLSITQIACELGGVSRNAVIGKVHRLKLPGRKRPVGVDKPPKRFRSLRSRGKPSPPQPLPVMEKLTSEVAMANSTPVKERRTVLQLKAGQCRWPYGDPRGKENFHFCDAKAVKDRPYCEAHCRIAYRVTEGRRSAA